MEKVIPGGRLAGMGGVLDLRSDSYARSKLQFLGSQKQPCLCLPSSGEGEKLPLPHSNAAAAPFLALETAYLFQYIRIALIVHEDCTTCFS